MDYELAVELKNAGFPHKDICGFRAPDCDCRDEINLSELIEACGEGFYQLTRSISALGDWFADGNKGEWGRTNGFTPEEAVARLWLVLNKKS